MVPILRAGLGMLDGVLDLIPSAKVSVVGIARNHETLMPEPYFERFVGQLDERMAMIIDPMLATGGSLIATIDMLKRNGCKQVRAIVLVAAPEGIQALQQRVEQRLAGRQALGQQCHLALCLRGSAQVANMALASVRKSALDEQRSQTIASMYQGSALEAPVREGFAVQRAVQRSMQEEMDQAGRNAISAKGFSLVAQRMAHLMREQFDLGFVDIGGWDTHVNQGAASGNLANRLGDLSQGLATFAGSMGAEAWRHTVVAVISEFGRTFRENGNKGTDHGHGTAYWFLGGGLSAQAGGKVLGEQIEVTEKALFQNRDYPVLNEYRSLLGGLFARMYGLNASQLQQIFPASQPGRLQLV